MNRCQQHPGNAPARVTLDRLATGQFHYWFGASGRAYLHTVFSPDDCPAIGNAVFLAVHRDEDGHRRAVSAGIIRPFRGGGEFFAATRSGANEIHLHLLAEGEAARRTTLDDLGRRHLPAAASSPPAHSPPEDAPSQDPIAA